MIKKLISILLLIFSISGCGYTTGSTLSSEFRTISVETFVNNINFTAEGQRNIYLPLLEIDTRNAIVDRFLFDGHLKIAEGEMADLALKGALKNYERTSLRL